LGPPYYLGIYQSWKVETENAIRYGKVLALDTLTSMAQWSTRINQVIFAVLDVSQTMGIKFLRFFVLIFAVFLPDFIFFVPQWHSHPNFIKSVDVFDLYTT